jgi:hypothetical protein
MTKRFKTDLRCGACVAKIAPAFDADPRVRRWQADVSTPDKVLTVEGEDVSAEHVGRLLGGLGYRITGEVADTPAKAAPPPGPPTGYYPLALIVAYLLGVVGLVEWANGPFHWERAMRHFMAGFFLAFSFFKLLDVRAFADSYATYDLLAGRSRLYALAYPFVELALGAAYLANLWPTLTSWVTLVVMLVGTAGVVRALLARRAVRCACLGSVFNLPMSSVTLVEDASMAVMAAVMLAAGH